MATSSRGVLGGAETMQQRRSWKEIRAARIAQQQADRAARQAAAAEDQEDADEEDDTAPTRPATKKRGKKAARGGLRMPSPAIPHMNSNRYTAIIIWLVGAYLTRALILQVGASDTYATPIAIVVQWLLTKAESPLWQRKGYPPLAIICTAIDGGMNSAGALVYTRNIGNTDFWAMIQYAAHDPALTPSVTTQIVLAIGCGLLVAAAAEYYWNLP